jgi:hypothetical protein
MKIPARAILIMVCSVLLLASCGEGGSSPTPQSQSQSPPPQQQPPPPSAGPAIKYVSPKFGFTVGVPALPACTSYNGICLAPTVADGSTQAWSIAPALPAGLTLSTTDGTITGTPTVASPATTYVVTAQGSAGTVSTFNLTITVESPVVLDLGHATNVDVIRYDSAHVLSHDQAGRWVLWNSATAAELASGTSVCSVSCDDPATTVSCLGAGCNGSPIVDLADNTVMIVLPGGFELRSATDGHLLSTINASLSWWRLATDGSYFTGGNKTGLTAWSPSGQVILSHAGDYSTAHAFAAAGEVRVAGGPAANKVETISLADGGSSLGLAYAGQFNVWFNDGERFLTNTGSTVWTYSKAGVQLDLTSVPNANGLAGQGDWFWIANGSPTIGFQIFKVGASSSPAFMTAITGPAVASGTTIGLLSQTATTVVDISGTAVTTATYPMGLSAYAAISSGAWLGTQLGSGLLFDGTRPTGMPKYFGYGRVLSIAGGSTFFAISTARGQVLYFDSATGTLQGTVDFPAFNLATSADGATLGMTKMPTGADFPAGQILSLPGTGLLQSWAAGAGPGTVTVSASGKLFGGVLQPPDQYTPINVRVSDVATGASVFSGTIPAGMIDGGVLISPDDAAMALLSDRPGPNAGTRIFKNNALFGAVPGVASAWLDTNRLLTNTYTLTHTAVPLFAGAFVYDSSGAQLVASSIPEVPQVQVLGPDTLYSSSLNSILSVSAGSRTWSSGNRTELDGRFSHGAGAVAGSKVVFVAAGRVLAQTY